MKITFADYTIATVPDFNGLDAVTGFVPKGTQAVQWLEPLRAPDATPVARGNRKQTITGTVLLSPKANLGSAMILRGLIFTQMPSKGALVLQIDGRQLTYPNAVLVGFEPVKDAKGISCGFQFTFNVGPGQESAIPIVTEPGGPVLVTEDGLSFIN